MCDFRKSRAWVRVRELALDMYPPQAEAFLRAQLRDLQVVEPVWLDPGIGRMPPLARVGALLHAVELILVRGPECDLPELGRSVQALDLFWALYHRPSRRVTVEAAAALLGAGRDRALGPVHVRSAVTRLRSGLRGTRWRVEGGFCACPGYMLVGPRDLVVELGA